MSYDGALPPDPAAVTARRAFAAAAADEASPARVLRCSACAGERWTRSP